MGGGGGEQGDGNERDRHSSRYALPVPLRIQPHEVARGRVEQEVALRKEHLVKQEEERVEGEYGDDPSGCDEGSRGEAAGSQHPKCGAVPIRANEAEGADTKREDGGELGTPEDSLYVGHMVELLGREDRGPEL